MKIERENCVEMAGAIIYSELKIFSSPQITSNNKGRG